MKSFITTVHENLFFGENSLQNLILEKVSRKEMDEVGKLASQWFRLYGVDLRFTKHFLERINDPRNQPEITKQDLINIFDELVDSHGMDFMKVRQEKEGVVKDIFSDINMPVVVKAGKFYAKTIMRKKDFFIGRDDEKYLISTSSKNK